MKKLATFYMILAALMIAACSTDPAAKYCWTHVPEEYYGNWTVYKSGNVSQSICEVLIGSSDIYIIGEGFSVSHFLRQNSDVYSYEERDDYMIHPYTLIIKERGSSRDWKVGFCELYDKDSFLVFLDTPLVTNQIYSLFRNDE